MLKYKYSKQHEIHCELAFFANVDELENKNNNNDFIEGTKIFSN